ncbi:MAG: hypothetical protein R3C10_21570 [Pirellulales bacterium]|nr:hypothetical protein [Planctomycetales bacterium]
MSETRKQLDELISSLKQQRDEIAVKAHLSKQEARDEWDRLTARLDDVLREYEPAKQAAESTAENVWVALKLAAAELKAGFERVRKSL